MNSVRRKGRVLALVFPALVLAVVLVSFAACGCGEKEERAEDLSIEEVWQRVKEAHDSARSFHMEIAGYYLNTGYGSGQIQSIILDVDGENLHERDLIFGQVYAEYIRVDGKVYSKDVGTGQWQEMAVEETGITAETYTSRFLDLPAVASSAEYVGEEKVNQRRTWHYRFTLDSSTVADLLAGDSSYDFSRNEGGVVDAWVDAETFHLARYQLEVKNVVISQQIGQGDVRFVIDITGVNEPVDITPPL